MRARLLSPWPWSRPRFQCQDLPGRRCIRLQHLETFEFRSLLTHELVGAGPRGAVIETMLARLDGIAVEPALSKRYVVTQEPVLTPAYAVCPLQASILPTSQACVNVWICVSSRSVLSTERLSEGLEELNAA